MKTTKQKLKEIVHTFNSIGNFELMEWGFGISTDWVYDEEIGEEVKALCFYDYSDCNYIQSLF